MRDETLTALTDFLARRPTKMIETKRLVFLQLQKSGCTHVEKILLQHYSGKQHYKHMPILDHTWLEGRAIVSSIRNPWDFYLSLWSFSCMRAGGPFARSTKPVTLLTPLTQPRLSWVPLARRAQQLGKHYVSEARRDHRFYERVFSDPSNPDHFREWLQRTLGTDHRFDQFPDYGYSIVGAGLLTYLHLLLASRNVASIFAMSRLESYDDLRRFYERENCLDKIIKTETLGEDLVAALRFCGHEVSETVQGMALSKRKTNASERCLSLGTAYDEETFELVANSDRFIIETYQYKFEAAHRIEYAPAGGRLKGITSANPSARDPEPAWVTPRLSA